MDPRSAKARWHGTAVPRLRATAVALGMALLVGACAVMAGASGLNADGNRAFAAGYYEEAEARYQSARDSAASGGDPEMVAVATYGLARTKLQLCRLAEAEALFKQSIAQREALTRIAGQSYTSQNRLELARLYLAQKRYGDANAQIEGSFPELARSGVAQSDPIAYADLLQDYAASLRAVNRSAEAERFDGDAQRLRRDNPYRVTGYHPTPFPARCGPAGG